MAIKTGYFTLFREGEGQTCQASAPVQLTCLHDLICEIRSRGDITRQALPGNNLACVVDQRGIQIFAVDVTN